MSFLAHVVAGMESHIILFGRLDSFRCNVAAPEMITSMDDPKMPGSQLSIKTERKGYTAVSSLSINATSFDSTIDYLPQYMV
jgi:hypothetical protein